MRFCFWGVLLHFTAESQKTKQKKNPPSSWKSFHNYRCQQAVPDYTPGNITTSSSTHLKSK